MQLEVTITGANVSIIRVEEHPGFQIAKQVSNGPETKLLVLPAREVGSTFRTGGQVKFADLVIYSSSSGAVSIKLNAAKTFLSARQADQPNAFSNILASVQDAHLSVSEAGTVLFEPTTRSLDDQVAPGLQRLLSSELLAAPTTAMLFATLQQPGSVKVEFGKTQELTTTVEHAGLSKRIAVRLSGLESGTQYYYRTVIEVPGASSRAVSALKSFTTPTISPTNKISKIRFEISPTRGSGPFVGYVLLLDADNRVVNDPPPKFSSQNVSVKFSPVTSLDGLHQATITPTATSSGPIRVSVNHGELTASQVLFFDPSYVEAKSAVVSGLPAIAQNQKTTLILLGLLAMMFVVGLMFAKLAKSR